MRPKESCRKLIVFLLVISVCSGLYAQAPFAKLDHWMDENTKDMGGRSILLIYKDGKIIYNKSVLHMSRRQKTIIKYIARRQGLDPDLNAYSMNSRVMVA